MFGFKSREQKAQERYEEYSKKRLAEERFNTLQENLKVLSEQKDKGKAVIEQIYRRHGIRIELLGSLGTLIEQAYLSDEVIDDLCLFTEEERKSLHKWAKCYKDCERHMIKMLEDYKKEEDEHRINDNM